MPPFCDLNRLAAENSCGKGYFSDTARVLAGRYPRLPRDCGNLPRRSKGETPAQLFHQAVDDLPILFFDVHQATEAGGGFDVPAGFGGGNCLVVLADPVLTEAAALGEQPHKVFGLALIRRLGCGKGEIGIIAGPVGAPR